MEADFIAALPENPQEVINNIQLCAGTPGNVCGREVRPFCHLQVFSNLFYPDKAENIFSMEEIYICFLSSLGGTPSYFRNARFRARGVV